SCSGATIDAVAPVTVASGCAWQSFGQCCRMISQRSALPGSVPSSASVALPANAIVWPAFQLLDGPGCRICGTGAVLPAVITTEATALAPEGSLTRTDTVTVDGV